jgi:adenine-specific DNA-methyltransferase
MIKDIMTKNESVNPNDREINLLKEHFSYCFRADGSFDMERFAENLKNKIDVTHEGYELKFLGKGYGKLLASLDTTTVIVPDEAHNTKPENQNSENIYISGDNLDGLKHLLKSYNGKVKCIYIDPPYNTGSDGFVYNDNFNFTVNDLVQKLSITEDKAQRILDLTKRGSASDSAWLMFMYPRLQLAHDLLNKNGVIFISIDDNEQANLKLICDDIMGADNFIAQIIIQSNKRGQTYKQLAKTHEYLLVYTKNVDVVVNELSKGEGAFKKVDSISEFEERELRNRNPKFGKFNRPNLFYPIFVNPSVMDVNGYFPASLTQTQEFSVEVLPFNSEGEESCWRWGTKKFDNNNCNSDTMNSNVVAKLKNTGSYGVYEKYRKGTFKAKTIWYNDNILADVVDEDEDDIWEETGVITEQGSKELGNYGMGDVFDFPKPTYLIEKVLTIGSDKDSICVDFFSGSGTTFEAILSMNALDNGKRNIISIQLPEDLDKKLDTASASDKPKIKKVLQFLDSVNRPHTLDQIGMERISRAAEKIRIEHPDSTVDLGFKHYLLEEPNQDTIDKMEKFEFNSIITDSNILNEFGTNTVLTTWLIHDGYGFNSECVMISLGDYSAYWCKKHLYLINPNFDAEATKSLIDKYDTEGTFNPDNIVIFGYSFNWVTTEALKTNLKILKDSVKNLKVNLNIRY